MTPDLGLFPWAAYGMDAWQRSVMFLDVLRQRGNAFLADEDDPMRNVLDFGFDLVMDGRDLPRPVNYWMARVTPPAGAPPADPLNRAFIVIDPRAGHGPGIGGFKADSEIGVAIAAGHPCYFVGFRPEPEPGQTIEDVVRAIIAFAEEVGRRHAGRRWQAGRDRQLPGRLGAADGRRHPAGGLRPAAGRRLRRSPTWAGVPGKAPMRYLGGLLGGSWLTRDDRRSRRRHVRRRLAGVEFRERQPGQHLLDQAVRGLGGCRQRGRPLPRLREVVGRPRQAERRGDAVHRRRAVRRQSAGDRRTDLLRRHAGRPARHRLADHRVLLGRRRHHAAGAGAVLDHRSLRRPERPAHARADHRLFRAWQHRASRHLRLGRRGAEGTRRVRHRTWT